MIHVTTCPVGPVSLVGVPEPGGWPERTGAPPGQFWRSCTPASSHLLGGGGLHKDGSLQQGGRGGAGKGGWERAGGKKHELGAGVLTSCPSSGSAPVGCVTLNETLILSKPFVPSPGKESFQRKGTKLQTALLGPGSNAPLGILPPCSTDREAGNVKPSSPGARTAQHPPRSSAKSLESLAQERRREHPAARGPRELGWVLWLRPQPAARRCRPLPTGQAMQRAHSAPGD